MFTSVINQLNLFTFPALLDSRLIEIFSSILGKDLHSYLDIFFLLFHNLFQPDSLASRREHTVPVLVLLIIN